MSGARRRIVVASEDSLGLAGQISQHFGGCAAFTVAEADAAEIVTHRVVPNPSAGAHRPGVLPVFVARELGADALIVGGIGAKAVQILSRQGIEVCAGFQGMVREGIEAYLRGERGTASPGCSHDHGCGEEPHGHGSHSHGGCGEGGGARG